MRRALNAVDPGQLRGALTVEDRGELREKKGTTMRRLIVGLGVVFTVLLMASVARAVPPDFCDEGAGHDDHRQCTTTTIVEPTTTTAAPPQLAACSTDMAVTGKGSASFDCLWTPANNGSEVATVTISNIEGGIKKAPVVFVLDDFPGDICALEQSWVEKPGQDYEVSFDLAYGHDLPDGYGAWEGRTYWDFVYDDETTPTNPMVGAYWCAPQDLVLDSLRLDTNGTPLHLRVVFNAGKGGQFDITLSPGQR